MLQVLLLNNVEIGNVGFWQRTVIIIAEVHQWECGMECLFCKITHWLTQNSIFCRSFYRWTSVRVAPVEGFINYIFWILYPHLNLFIYLSKSFVWGNVKSLWSSCQGEGGGSSWIPEILWGLMELIQEYSKRWLISQGLFQGFFNDLGNLARSQSTEHWPVLAQYSRRAGRMTLKTTGLSVSRQCLVKLWTRLFWELLKNTWRT